MAEQIKWLLPIIGVLFVVVILAFNYVKLRNSNSKN